MQVVSNMSSASMEIISVMIYVHLQKENKSIWCYTYWLSTTVVKLGRVEGFIQTTYNGNLYFIHGKKKLYIYSRCWTHLLHVLKHLLEIVTEKSWLCHDKSIALKRRTNYQLSHTQAFPEQLSSKIQH